MDNKIYISVIENTKSLHLSTFNLMNLPYPLNLWICNVSGMSAGKKFMVYLQWSISLILTIVNFMVCTAVFLVTDQLVTNSLTRRIIHYR